MIIRNKKLHELCDVIRKEVPSWIGSIPEFCESTDYMSNEFVENELKRFADNHRKLVERYKGEKDRCGEPTREEKIIFNILKQAGY